MMLGQTVVYCLYKACTVLHCLYSTKPCLLRHGLTKACPHTWAAQVG